MKRFVVVHFWPVKGGFANAYRRICGALAQRGTLMEAVSPGAFLKRLFGGSFAGNGTGMVIFSSLLAPVVLVLSIIHPRLRIFYEVRGDEVDWALAQNRYLRASVATCCQRLLRRLPVRFVFASGDLKKKIEGRIGPITNSRLLPNTVGRPLPKSRPLGCRLALVGDFGTVKNIEWALVSLASARFQVDLYGNTSLPEKWNLPWIHAHGIVLNLAEHLNHSDVVVFSSTSEGFPWVILDAAEAGCAMVFPDSYPFRMIPVTQAWRYSMGPLESAISKKETPSPLETTLMALINERRDFRADNPALFELLETPWNALFEQSLE